MLQKAENLKSVCVCVLCEVCVCVRERQRQKNLEEETFWERLDIRLEKEMATQSSILAWEIPRTRGAWRLQSMGSQRVGHD